MIEYLETIGNRTPIRIYRRPNGGAELRQSGSVIRLDRAELADVLNILTEIEVWDARG